ncbi:DUF5719 family protein [Brachybacterium sp. p3-SID1565]|uniref:Large extracellular alpha-helical protein n=1 Tax=Brachybacterium epidermidis TaxID=2781983 RepID=A0ABR9VXN7_9MICO|nr:MULTISPECIES: DUF5719 family protein [Brachybacterium]MBE9402950.1 hypothetical protein [Brachybacterium epidermidis]MCT1385571.1 DUF5719 family protein [Brachybacterium sp. p3-SID1565]
MSEHDHHPVPLDDHVPGHRTGRLRPVLALVSLLPLAAAVGALAITPQPGPTTVERSVTSAEAGGVQLWCPGPLDPPQEALGAGTDEDLAVIPPSPAVDVRTVALEPASSLLFGRVSGSETRLEEDGSVRAPSITALGADGQALTVPTVSRDLGAAVQTVTGAEDTLQVQTTGSEGGRAVSDTVQTTVTTEGDYRSLAMSRCLPTATDAAFLGVSTQRGASSQLVLSNPGDRPATAAVQVWTADGPATMAGRSQVVVAPRTEQRILLESIAPGHDHVGVRAEVIGAPLVMHMQTTERDGLTPGGAEILAPTSAPAREQIVPGVRVEQAAPTLVLANTQGEDATATVTVMGTGGPLPDAEQEVTVPAGAVVPVALDGVPEGDHAVRVDSSQPLLAVVRSETSGADLPGDTIGAPVDFALAAPAPELGSHSVVALPAGGQAGHLTLTATEDTEVTVAPISENGAAAEPIVMQIAAETVATVPTQDLQVDGEPAAGVTVVPERPGVLHASWVQQHDDGAGGTLLATLPVTVLQNTDVEVSVRLSE